MYCFYFFMQINEIKRDDNKLFFLYLSELDNKEISLY